MASPRVVGHDAITDPDPESARETTPSPRNRTSDP